MSQVGFVQRLKVPSVWCEFRANWCFSDGTSLYTIGRGGETELRIQMTGASVTSSSFERRSR